jgi:peptidoglycan hydrolase-like amidase
MKKASALLLMTAALSLVATSAMASPVVKEVKQKDGTVRLDVAERPSNGTPEAQQGTKLVVDPQGVTAAAYTMPSSIRVGIRANNSTANPIGYVSVVPWYDYNIDVLPNEWIGSWPAQSLNAGAIAVKMYAWYHILHPKYSTCDVDNTVNSQVYKPNSRYSSTTTAVNTMSGIGILKSGVMFETQYRAGSYDSSIPGTNIMSQNGTHYFADQGKTWSWMTSYYYPGSATFTY